MSTKKAKKPSKKANKKNPKVTKLKPAAGNGHNGAVNKPLQKLFASYSDMEKDKKQISKAQRDLRAKAKEEHNVDKEVFMHEIKMQKKAPDARVMFEQGHADLKNSLGYQHVLPLLEGDGEEEQHEEGAPETVDERGGEDEKEVA